MMSPFVYGEGELPEGLGALQSGYPPRRAVQLLDRERLQEFTSMLCARTKSIKSIRAQIGQLGFMK